MPGSTLYNSIRTGGGTAAAVRSGTTLSSSGGGGKKGDVTTSSSSSSQSTSTHTTVTASASSARTKTRTSPVSTQSQTQSQTQPHNNVQANAPTSARVGGNATRDANTGIENNNSIRSNTSTSTSGDGSARKMRRGSFRKTLMHQRSKRNSFSSSSNSTSTGNANTSSSSNNSNNTPDPDSASTTASTSTNNRSVSNRSQAWNSNSNNNSHRIRSSSSWINRSLVPLPVKSLVGATAVVTEEEEREAGACSPPTFPSTNSTSNTTNTQNIIGDGEGQKEQPQHQEPHQQQHQLPRGHVETILKIYGNGGTVLDLYRDVLQVSPKASDRSVRIAYFRRGREILGDTASSKNKSKDKNKQAVSKLDLATKERFQAVSMAYEILSTPGWKEAYRKQGGLGVSTTTSTTDLSSSKAASAKQHEQQQKQNQEPFDPFVSSPLASRVPFPGTASPNRDNPLPTPTTMTPTTSTPNHVLPAGRPQRLPTALRKSSFVGTGNGANSLRRKRLLPSVRWKDHVEELVFVQHPNENAFSDESGSESDSCSSDEGDGPVSADATDAAAALDLYADPSISGRGGRSNYNTNDKNNTNNNNSASHSSRGSGSSNSRGRQKKNKQKIVIDSEALESHLQRMDSEAEKHFVQDFWDNFEESMDGILSLVDSMGGGGTDASSKTGGKKKKKFYPSSWLSSSSSSNANQKQRKNSMSKQDAATATSIGQSTSQDMSLMSLTKTKSEDGGDVLKRSKSLPTQQTSSSSSTTMGAAVASSPPPTASNPILQDPPTTGVIVTPDNKGATPRESSRTSSSPYDMILNSWPFQSSEEEGKKNTQLSQQQLKQHTAATSAIVSPASKTASFDPSSDLDTTTSVASTIFSTSQRQQKQLFRPISPSLSEASEALNSDFVPPGSSSGDPFELESCCLSEMESLDLTELDNPFRREKNDSSSPTLSVQSNTNVGIQKTLSSDSNNSIARKNPKKKKKNRFRVSMMSRIRGSASTEKEVPSSHDAAKTETSNKSVISSGASIRSKQSVEDVFEGVEDVSSQQQQLGKADKHDQPNDAVEMEKFSMKRSGSQMSDLSESVYSASKKESDDDAEEAGLRAKNPAAPSANVPANESRGNVTFAPSVTTCSVVSESTKKSLVNSTTGRSEGGLSSLGSTTSSTRDGGNSFQSLDFDSSGVETSGFFDYFTAYATAVMTECANLGAATGASEYQQEFMGMFSGDTSVQTAEFRE